MKSSGITMLFMAATLLAAGCPSKTPATPCKVDKDCKPGERCVSGKCQGCAKDADCGPGKTCLNGLCRPKPGYCDNDRDCADGQICRDNLCRACKEDSECKSGRCQAGKCAETMGGSCQEDDDCADNEVCQGGKCVASAKPYTGPALCALKTVFFAFNEFGVRQQDQTTLEENAKCIQSVKDRKVYLNGHCDSRGTEEYNLALSNQRAQAVRKYLEELGVPADRLHVVPKGELESSGTDEEGWAKDRKVEPVWY